VSLEQLVEHASEREPVGTRVVRSSLGEYFWRHVAVRAPEKITHTCLTEYCLAGKNAHLAHTRKTRRGFYSATLILLHLIATCPELVQSGKNTMAHDENVSHTSKKSTPTDEFKIYCTIGQRVNLTGFTKTQLK